MAVPPRLALVGFRASGKSTVGPLVARSLGWVLVDMDEELTRSFGDSIAAWVERFGWARFRQEESRLLERLSRQTHIVVATGGGVVESAINRQRLQKDFFSVWLCCRLETICHRLALDDKTATQRPSLTGRSIIQETAEVLQQRTHWYAASAHLVLEADAFPLEVLAQKILQAYEASAGFDRTVS